MASKADLQRIQKILSRFEELGCTEESSPTGDTVMRRSCEFKIVEFAGKDGKDVPTWVTSAGSDSEFCYVRGEFSCSSPEITEMLAGMQLGKIPKKSYDENPMELGTTYSAQCTWIVTDDEDKLYENYADRTFISVFSNVASVSSVKALFE